MLREDYSPVSPAQSSTSFLECVVCRLTPAQPPLHGCESSHIICSNCRAVGGSLLSCPQCGSSNLHHRWDVPSFSLSGGNKLEIDILGNFGGNLGF